MQSSFSGIQGNIELRQELLFFSKFVQLSSCTDNDVFLRDVELLRGMDRFPRGIAEFSRDIPGFLRYWRISYKY